MAPRSRFSVVTRNLSDAQRVEFILELTRRLELLDELLQAAREKRRAISGGAFLADAHRRVGHPPQCGEDSLALRSLSPQKGEVSWRA